MRARYPDVAATVERDGLALGYEVFGEGDTTVLLLPTWTIVHSRFWKMQVPYLSRHYQVVTYDGPGNGRSDRSVDPSRYAADAYAADAVAVLDACGVDRAVVVGLSMGGQYGARMATLHQERVAGLVLVGPALPLAPDPDRATIADNFLRPYPENPEGWDKYNLAYWHDHYSDFAEFFFSQIFCEPHSTKAIEDAVGWAAETGPDVLEAEAMRTPVGADGTRASVAAPETASEVWSQVLGDIDCPVLVIHGTHDRIQPHQAGFEAARLAGGELVTFEGSGHMPNVRDPIRFNLVLREFVERVAG